MRKGLRLQLEQHDGIAVVGEAADGREAVRLAEELAAMLKLSPYTVETHRTHIMQKLDLHSAVDLVLCAVRKKIIS